MSVRDRNDKPVTKWTDIALLSLSRPVIPKHAHTLASHFQVTPFVVLSCIYFLEVSVCLALVDLQPT